METIAYAVSSLQIPLNLQCYAKTIKEARLVFTKQALRRKIGRKKESYSNVGFDEIVAFADQLVKDCVGLKKLVLTVQLDHFDNSTYQKLKMHAKVQNWPKTIRVNVNQVPFFES